MAQNTFCEVKVTLTFDLSKVDVCAKYEDISSSCSERSRSQEWDGQPENIMPMAQGHNEKRTMFPPLRDPLLS